MQAFSVVHRVAIPHGLVVGVSLPPGEDALSEDDIDRLLGVLHRLVDAGHMAVLIEHQLDVIRSADHLLDLGPEGGDGGGQLMAKGRPEQVAKVEKSWTGQALRAVL